MDSVYSQICSLAQICDPQNQCLWCFQGHWQTCIEWWKMCCLIPSLSVAVEQCEVLPCFSSDITMTRGTEKIDALAVEPAAEG